jgi:hypothetical protein
VSEMGMSGRTRKLQKARLGYVQGIFWDMLAFERGRFDSFQRTSFGTSNF